MTSAQQILGQYVKYLYLKGIYTLCTLNSIKTLMVPRICHFDYYCH